MKRWIVIALLGLAACSQQDQPAQDQSQAQAPAQAQSALAASIDPGVPAGAYTLDKAHASLLFRVDHLGFSNYTARFRRFDAKLQFDPANLAQSSVTATIDSGSLETDYPDPQQHDFNAQLTSEQWLDGVKFPQMTYQSTKVEVTGPNTVRVHGNLTLRGVTRPVVLDAKFNGGYAGMSLDPNARIGFSAHGTLERSEFGISYGIPDPGSKFGVSDEIQIAIEAEFNGPPWQGAKT
jgi:polyisoprenoid-binding protein YceI